mgnify:CR=1 FL=1
MKKIILTTISIICLGFACAQQKTATFNHNTPITDSVELNGQKYITVSFHANIDKLMYVVEQIKECGWEFASCQAEQNSSIRICAKHPMKANSPTPVLCIGKFDYPDGTVSFEGVTPYGKKSVLTRTFRNGKLVSETSDGRLCTPKFIIAPDVKDVW